jgi:hypothetical protein
MDRTMLCDHLEQARRHVAEGERHIARQKDVVAGLERHGRPSGEARRLLGNFEELQQMHLADLHRILGELGKLDAG